MPEPWITLDELASYLSPRAPRDLTGDVLAEISTEGACDLIRTRAEQLFDVVTDDTVTFSGRDSHALILPEAPVIEVDEVRVDDEVELDWELTASGILRRTERGCWPYGDGNIAVDYSHGYEVMPADLRLLALTVAARHYQQGIAKQESTGNASVTFSVAAAGDLSSGEMALVAKYRRPSGERLAAAVGS